MTFFHIILAHVEGGWYEAPSEFLEAESLRLLGFESYEDLRRNVLLFMCLCKAVIGSFGTDRFVRIRESK